MVLVKFKKIHENAVIPSYANPGDAGLDIHSPEQYIVNPNETLLVKTGLQMELPIGYEAQIRPRSGLALKESITVLNSPGTIDHGYRGEVGVILINHGTKPYSIKIGDRIAQFVINKHENPTIEEVINLEDSERGEGGFGSSGK